MTIEFTIPIITEERDAPWTTTLCNRLDEIIDAIDNLNSIDKVLLANVISNLDVVHPGINAYQDFLNKQELNYDANEMDMRLLYGYKDPLTAIYNNLPVTSEVLTTEEQEFIKTLAANLTDIFTVSNTFTNDN